MDSHKKIITRKSTQLKWLFYADWVTSGQFSWDSIYLFFFCWSVIGGTSNMKDFGWDEATRMFLRWFWFHSVNRNSFEVKCLVKVGCVNFDGEMIYSLMIQRCVKQNDSNWNDLTLTNMRFDRLEKKNSLEKIKSEKKIWKKNRFKSKIDL